MRAPLPARNPSRLRRPMDRRPQRRRRPNHPTATARAAPAPTERVGRRPPRRARQPWRRASRSRRPPRSRSSATSWWWARRPPTRRMGPCSRSRRARPTAAHGPDIYLWRVGDATAQPITSDHASVFSGWLSNQLLGSRAVDEAGRPASDAVLHPLPRVGGAGLECGGVRVGRAHRSPCIGIAVGRGITDHRRRRLRGSLALKRRRHGWLVSHRDRRDGDDRGLPDRRSPGCGGRGRGAADRPADRGCAGRRADRPGWARPAGSVCPLLHPRPGSGAETSLLGPAWRPVVDPTGRFVAYWAGSLRYDASALSWLPDRGALVLASWPALRGSRSDRRARRGPAPRQRPDGHSRRRMGHPLGRDRHAHRDLARGRRQPRAWAA